MTEAAEFSRKDRPGRPTLVVVGEIDLANARPFAEELAELVGDAHSPAVVDLSGVTFFDSSGINVLVRTHAKAAEAGVELILEAPSHQVVTVLKLTGLGDHFQTSGGPLLQDVTSPSPAHLEHQSVLPVAATSVRLARSLLKSALAEHPMSEAEQEWSLLAISELVTNAVLYGERDLSVKIIPLPAGLEVEITDGSPERPVLGRPPPNGPGG